jgi:hypothetical protein
MNSGTIHTIQRQRFDICFRDGRKGLGLPGQLSELCRQRITPLLDMILDQYDRPGYFLRLDRIVIDLGVLPSGRWEQILPERVAKQFAEELRRRLPAVSLSSAERDHRKQASGPGNHRWEEEPAAFFTAYLHFLSTGVLAGPARNMSLGELETQLGVWLPNLEHPGWKEQLIQLLGEAPLSLERFLLQASPALRDTLLQWLGYGNEQLSISVSGAASLNPLVRLRLETLLRLWQGLSVSGQGSRHHLVAPAVVLEKILSGLSDRRLEHELRKLLPKASFRIKDPDDRHTILPAAQQPEEQEIFIGNAGLVLLHPFLPAYMKQLRLLRANGQWKDAVAQQRGVWLCQYLVDGGSQLEEQAVFLNKLLCGWPLAQPLERQWEPSPDESAEADQLLEQVIAHWSVLKNTSIDGLRASFLRREGKLTQGEGVWLLQVEQKTWDVLLGFLPWGLGYIKTPWMEERLLTEWG